jgi:Glycosyl hydrolase catalytic core
MNRRTALRILAPSLFITPAMSIGASAPSAKKGWAGGNANLHKLFGAHWYYTWGTGGHDNPEIEFVPMIKGRKNIEDKNSLDQVRNAKKIKHLLGYNEPERADQGNLSVADALKHWPKLQAIAEAKNIPLGSPCTSSDGKGLAWFAEFMKEAKRLKLRIDFIAMHWYRSRDAGDFEIFLKGLAREHRLPIWLTEFNGWSGTEKENYGFLKSALKFLEKEKTIERYAYFEPGKGKEHSLLAADGSLTRMGELYRDAGV